MDTLPNQPDSGSSAREALIPRRFRGTIMRAMKDLGERTKRFALRVIAEVEELRSCPTSWVLGKQLLNSGTAVGAIYREAERAESRADFIHKIGMAAKEAAESCYWLELLSDSRTASAERIQPLLKEANELLAILVASGRTAKNRTDPPRT